MPSIDLEAGERFVLATVRPLLTEILHEAGFIGKGPYWWRRRDGVIWYFYLRRSALTSAHYVDLSYRFDSLGKIEKPKMMEAHGGMGLAQMHDEPQCMLDVETARVAIAASYWNSAIAEEERVRSFRLCLQQCTLPFIDAHSDHDSLLRWVCNEGRWSIRGSLKLALEAGDIVCPCE